MFTLGKHEASHVLVLAYAFLGLSFTIRDVLDTTTRASDSVASSFCRKIQTCSFMVRSLSREGKDGQLQLRSLRLIWSSCQVCSRSHYLSWNQVPLFVGMQRRCHQSAVLAWSSPGSPVFIILDGSYERLTNSVQFIQGSLCPRKQL